MLLNPYACFRSKILLASCISTPYPPASLHILQHQLSLIHTFGTQFHTFGTQFQLFWFTHFSGCPCNATSAAASFRCPAGYRCSRSSVKTLSTDLPYQPTLVLLGAVCVACGNGQYCPEGTYLEVWKCGLGREGMKRRKRGRKGQREDPTFTWGIQGSRDLGI